MYIICIHDKYAPTRYFGTWTAFEDAQDYGVENHWSESFEVCRIDLVNDDRAPRNPHLGGTPIEEIKVKGEML